MYYELSHCVLLYKISILCLKVHNVYVERGLLYLTYVCNKQMHCLALFNTGIQDPYSY